MEFDPRLHREVFKKTKSFAISAKAEEMLETIGKVYGVVYKKKPYPGYGSKSHFIKEADVIRYAIELAYNHIKYCESTDVFREKGTHAYIEDLFNRSFKFDPEQKPVALSSDDAMPQDDDAESA